MIANPVEIPQVSPSILAWNYATGVALILVTRHTRAPTPINPFLMAAAMLPDHLRPQAASGPFIGLLFPDEKEFALLISGSSSSTPISSGLAPHLEVAGIPVRHQTHSMLLLTSQ